CRSTCLGIRPQLGEAFFRLALLLQALTLAGCITLAANGSRVVSQAFAFAVDDSPGVSARLCDDSLGFALRLITFRQETALVLSDRRQSRVLVFSVLFHGTPIRFDGISFGE